MTRQEIFENWLYPLTQDKETLHLFYPSEAKGFGDFFIVGGLLTAFAEKSGKKNVAMFIDEKFSRLGADFEGVNMIYMPSAEHKIIADYIADHNLYVNENYFYGWFHRKNTEGNLIRNGNTDFLSEFKEILFNLPLDTKLEEPTIHPPAIDEKINLHRRYIIDKKRTIILFPHCRSSEKFPDIFWTVLVKELRRSTPPLPAFANIYEHKRFYREYY